MTQNQPDRYGRTIQALLSAILVIGILVVGYFLLRTPATAAGIRPFDTELVAEGADLYQLHCASCHGAALEGQPNWKERLPSGLLPAPPHDESGHTWHHDDQLLFKIVSKGGQAYTPPGEQSGMPAYGTILSEDEIWAILSYIKSTWPAEIQQMHDQVNQQSGM